jgi:ABC-type Fe3+ transport system substrate-binding protein
VDAKIAQSHPDCLKHIPASFGGDKLYSPEGKFYGVVLSTFGILYNTRRLAEMGGAPPMRWEDMGDKKYFNTLAVADPTKSGSANKCYEIMIQQCMAKANDPAQGWYDGFALLKKIFVYPFNVKAPEDPYVLLSVYAQDRPCFVPER